MYSVVYQWFGGDARDWARAVSIAVTLCITLALAVLLPWLVYRLLTGLLRRVLRRTARRWVKTLLDARVSLGVAALVVPLVLLGAVEGQPRASLTLYYNIVSLCAVCAGWLLLDSLVRAVDIHYRYFAVSKQRPLSGLLQVVRVVVAVVALLLAVARLMGENPLVLLGGFSAVGAVASLVFRDAILGFVAGLQLTSSGLLRIGDWIEVPGQLADGTVVDLTMTTVKVQNFNNAITLLPAYTLLSQPFINWRGMQEAGGRRIKRALRIDAADVRWLNDDDWARLSNVELLAPYLAQKRAELDAANAASGVDVCQPLNGRRLSNLGTFRAYILSYLRSHPRIHHGMSMMTRQMEAQDDGIPLEIYAFTDTVVWSEFEAIQSDIFEHFYAVIGEFGLHLYQHPSGSDLRAVKGRFRQ